MRCCVCGGETYRDTAFPLCDACEREADEAAIRPEEARCGRCGKPLVSEHRVCTRCREGEFAYDEAFPLFRYRGAAREIILAYKSRNRRSLSAWFAHRLASALRDRFEDMPVVPVPPRLGKLRARGWDQVEKLAGKLESTYGVSILRILERAGGAEQKALSLAARAANAKGKFAVKHGAMPPSGVVLLDDVLTTGATLSACAEALKAAGAEAVSALVIAAD